MCLENADTERQQICENAECKCIAVENADMEMKG
jgi:hypothetical protein